MSDAIFTNTDQIQGTTMKQTATALIIPLLLIIAGAATATEPVYFNLSEEIILPSSSEGGSWFQPRPTAMPGYGNDGGPAVVMTIQKALGSDFFSGLEFMRSDDMGLTWTTPQPVPELGWRDGDADDGEDGLTIGICDFTLGWHEPTGKVLGIGHTVRYTETGFAGYGYRRDTAYSVYDPQADQWTPWTVLDLPETPNDKYYFNGSHGQWLVEPDGSLLVPIYHVPAGEDFVATGIVARCEFDGNDLTFVEHGNELTHSVPRGLYEKSITKYDGRYYMTMRNDVKGYVSVSDDGLNFGPIQAWTFDDGTELGSYNTQQKWVTNDDGLFLVYTRRGADNDHIIRHRAPLFMAQVDTDNLQVIRSTERIAVAERGAPLGNFDATIIDENETWITVAGGPAYCTRVTWTEPELQTVVPGGTVPYAWYRADAGVTLAPDTDLVSQWGDQSGNNRNLQVAGGNPRLTANGPGDTPALTFDGDDKLLGAASQWGAAAAGTVLAIWKAADFDTTHGDNITFLYDGSDPADGERDRQFLLYGELSSGAVDHWMQGGGYDDDNDSYNGSDRLPVDDAGLGQSVIDQWFVTAVTHTSGTDDTLRVNGREIYSGNMLSSGLNGIKVGYAVNEYYGFHGELCELIVFEGLLDEIELAAVEQELMVRWGLATRIPGDANSDGQVDVSDLGILATNYGSGIGFGWRHGDFTGDTVVDVSDLGVLATAYGTITSSQAVPEPGIALMLAGGLLVLLLHRRT